MADLSDSVAVQQEGARAAVAHVLRPDQTAYMRLGLVALSDGTWRVETVESCPGDWPPD